MSIIDLMKELQYPTDEAGVCKGLALMAQRARWSGQFDKFQARMKYLSSLKPNQLQGLLQEAKQHEKDLRENKTIKPLSQNEQTLLTVEAFFFQIWAHFSPHETQKFLDLHDGEYFNQLQTHTIEEIMYDQGSEDKTISPLPHPDRFLFRASNDNCNSLKVFLETIKHYDDISPGCVISSVNHDIHVFYNKTKNQWILTNHDEILERESIDEITAEIIYAFKKRRASDDIVNICINVYADKKIDKAHSLSQELTKITNEAFDKLLEQTSDINQGDVNGDTLLHVAAMYGLADKVLQLTHRSDINLNSINEGKFSAPLLAIMFGQAEVVHELLKHPIDKTAAMYEQKSALYWASAQSSVEIVDGLIRKFGVPNAYLAEQNPLGVAVLNNRYAIIKRLLKEPDIRKDILPYALSKGSDNKTISILLADPNIEFNSRYMCRGALHLAAERGDINLVNALLALGRQVIPTNEENILHWMPFEHFIRPNYHANTIYLAYSGEYKVFNIHGEVRTGVIDTSTINLSGLRPYQFALLSDLNDDPEKSVNGHIYLSKDGDYTVRDHEGTIYSGKIPEAFLSGLNMKELATEINTLEFQSKVTFALTQAGHTQINTVLKNQETKSRIFSQLFNAGSIISFIDVNIEDPQRDKPFSIAAQHGHLNIVRELLKHPDIDLNYRQGLSKPTLLTQIVRSKTPDAIKTLELILDHPKIDVNLKDDTQLSPLCTAVRYGNVNAVKALLKHKAIDVNQGNPLEIAIREGHFDILKLLIIHPNINMTQPTSEGFLPLNLAAWHAYHNSRYDKYVKVMLSQSSVLSQDNLSQFSELDSYWQNYYQAQPLIQSIQKSIASLNKYHNGYTKLLITDKEPQENEIDKNTIVLINNGSEWIIYRKIENKLDILVLDKSALDIDLIRSVDNKQFNKIHNDHELIDYILNQCEYTYINVIDTLQCNLGDFISDLKHVEYDKEGITSVIDNFCNQTMHICNSDRHSKQPLFFSTSQSAIDFNELFTVAREECLKRIEQYHHGMQPAPSLNNCLD
ncbi:ankyrin repeat domain-containing protein [Legionella parisiensis]|uniref:Phosphocholine transferase AnkX n=1 Tax=Legionella parisiensis TaxID=45071 RepID=A0A1E5JW70_9GAMM|nr:ankyrin repeat domain-containing protein [Legionella parisiensis]KTD40134.1 Ankyrin repeats (3 copies) [Legionella parisiensis]OEH48623.1 hypothetical protein lpari_00382 [Legionella parisiensis]STX77321.1 Ribulose-5-phosphate 4-epimerase and related epimerases and aldolases [Legionella parisiensis]